MEKFATQQGKMDEQEKWRRHNKRQKGDDRVKMPEISKAVRKKWFKKVSRQEMGE
jgi:hypothetical protein